MSALSEVVGLLGDLAGGSVRDRVTAVAAARTVVGRLRPDQKRELAVRVAERVAPQLVPRIEAGVGEDLTPEQVATVFELFRRLDPAEVVELRQVLADAEEPVASAPEDDPELAPEPTPGPGPEPEPEPEQEPVSELEPEPRPEAEPEAVGLEPEPEPEVEPAREDHPGPQPDPAPPPAAADTLAAVRTARTAMARLRAVADADATALWRAGPEHRRQLLEAVPDGWQRRRALDHLLKLDVISAAEAPPLVQRFARRGDRIWVSARFADADLFDADDLAQVLDARAAARLAARTS